MNFHPTQAEARQKVPEETFRTARHIWMDGMISGVAEGFAGAVVRQEKGRAGGNRVKAEVLPMYAAWLLFGGLLYALQLSPGSFPRPLTAEEEANYLQQYARGDPAARDALIEHNLRLVAHIMKKYYALSSDQDDMISIGTIGLIKAISTFDASKGARLATYAARCIENSIRSRRNKWPLRWRTELF